MLQNQYIVWIGDDVEVDYDVVFSLLPIVEVTTDSGDVISTEVQRGTIRVIDAEKRNLEETLACDLWVRGASSKYRNKKSYGITLVWPDGEERDEELLGIRSQYNWILDVMAIDKSRMRNRLIFAFNIRDNTCKNLYISLRDVFLDNRFLLPLFLGI